MTGAHARWEVLWVARRKDGSPNIQVREFDTDLHGALDLYTRAKLAGKKMVTLRCANVGFAPPEKYRPRTVKKVKREGRRKRIVEVYIEPMRAANTKGLWWCPYCITFRRFDKQDGAMLQDGDREYFVNGDGMYCPICQISHNDHHVRKWNPQAQMLQFRQPRARRSSGSRRRKRARS